MDRAVKSGRANGRLRSGASVSTIATILSGSQRKYLFADAIVRTHQRYGHAMRRQRGAVVDVVHPFQRGVLPPVDFEDQAGRAVQPGLVVADRRRGDEGSVGPYAGDFDQRGVERTQEPLPGHRRDLAEMHVEVFHFSAIYLFARDRVRIVRQAELDPVRPRQRAIEFGSRRRPGPHAQAKWRARRIGGFDARRQRERDRLRIAGSGKAAHADGRAGLDERRRVVRAHDFRLQPHALDPVVAHWPPSMPIVCARSAWRGAPRRRAAATTPL